jgi:hypothetical protein
VTNSIDHDVVIVRFALATIRGVFDAAKLTAGNPPSELLWTVPNVVVKFKFCPLLSDHVFMLLPET